MSWWCHWLCRCLDNVQAQSYNRVSTAHFDTTPWDFEHADDGRVDYDHPFHEQHLIGARGVKEASDLHGVVCRSVSRVLR